MVGNVLFVVLLENMEAAFCFDPVIWCVPTLLSYTAVCKFYLILADGDLYKYLENGIAWLICV